MASDRWREIEALYHSASAKPTADQAPYLRRACGSDHELRREVESLLAFDDLATRFLESDGLMRSRTVTEPSIPPGEEIGPYRVLEFVAKGGMGEVYRSRDLRLDRTVAIKFLPKEFAADRAALDRFRREARAASILNHPRICTVHDAGEYHGQPFFVMEFLEGQSLRDRINGKPLPVRELVDYGVQICDALQAAHAKGIIHRDIKPANIFVGDNGQIKILDFGLAKLVPDLQRETESVHAVSAGNCESRPMTFVSSTRLVGTLAYLSPEQVQGDPLDARTDIYSLGVVLYQMATGSATFRGETSGELIDAILHQAPPKPSTLNPDIPGRLERVILKALEKERNARYQSVSGMFSDLEHILFALRKERHPRSLVFALSALAVAGGILSWILAPLSPPALRLRQITTDTENKTWPVVSDGSRLYFFSFPHDREARLMQVPILGGRPVAVHIPLPGWHIHLFDISPNGRELLMRADNRLGEPGPLWTVRIADGSARRIVADGVLSARYSPDGNRIAWSAGEKLYVRDAIRDLPSRRIASQSRDDLTVLSWISPEKIVLSTRKDRPVTPYGWGWGGFGGSTAWHLLPMVQGSAAFLGIGIAGTTSEVSHPTASSCCSYRKARCGPLRSAAGG